MDTKITIAIDGHSSTGKSTVAKQLAKALDYIYVDTGAMYRAVTWYALENNIINQSLNTNLLIEELPNIDIRFIQVANFAYPLIHVNGKNVDEDIRSIEVSKWVSKVAAISEVRKKLVEQQQQMGKDKGIVMDGRDIGTVVFPDAELKLFMTASAEIRAERRYNELLAKGKDINYQDVLDNVNSRDIMDSTRKDSPLVQAKDAILIDNSTTSREEQFEQILSLVKAKITQ